MPKKAIVLGCGLVGATMAKDLAADPALAVTVADVNDRNLRAVRRVRNLATLRADLSKPARLKKLLAGFDVVVGALPSRFGFQTLEAVIAARKPYCDISFMAEDALELDALARQKGVTAVVDCGVAPGLANLAIGYAAAALDRVDEAVYYVGGLPRVRRFPYEYKAPFAPSDVIEEYTRPARMIEGGRLVTRPALSEPELMDFPGVGTLEAFNTDGLRSLLVTVKATNMREKTLRYPGHAHLMRVLAETGFFAKEPVKVGKVAVRPLDLTSALLFPLWQKAPDEDEFTVLKVIVRGKKGRRRWVHTTDLFDQYDPRGKNSSMARTTGFPCTIVARLLCAGKLHRPGVLPPERLGRFAGFFDHMRQQLAARGVALTHRVEPA